MSIDIDKDDLKNATGFCYMATGTYTGDGNATQGITGVGFQPRVVQIYPQTFGAMTGPCSKTDQDGLRTKFHDIPGAQWHWVLDFIISLDADGFTVGDGTGYGNVLNLAPIVYTYIAWG